jgi:hypothetical protein
MFSTTSGSGQQLIPGFGSGTAFEEGKTSRVL